MLGLAKGCHPGPVAVVTTASIGMARVFGGQRREAIRVGAAVFAGQLAIGWQNDWVDAERDRLTGRSEKPIASDLIGRGTVGTAAVLAAAPVKVQVQVVHASNDAPHVDPGLEKMRQGFETAGLRFTSYRRLSEQTVSLVPAKPTDVALPGKTATLTLQPGDHPRPQVAVSVPPLQTTVDVRG